LSRGQPQGQPPEVLDAVLRADASKLPAVIGVDLGAQGYVVARVDKVLPRAAVPGGEAALVGQYTQAWTDAEVQAYLAALRSRYKVKINEDVVAESAASSPGS
jgi:peptidyl-prolyl cis-trans isomerase D